MAAHLSDSTPTSFRLYADKLKALLDAVDDFLGDAKMSERTLFPHLPSA
jgi:hypothetical protein